MLFLQDSCPLIFLCYMPLLCVCKLPSISPLLGLIMLPGLFPVLDCRFPEGRDHSVLVTIIPLLSGTKQGLNKTDE